MNVVKPVTKKVVTLRERLTDCLIQVDGLVQVSRTYICKGYPRK